MTHFPKRRIVSLSLLLCFLTSLPLLAEHTRRWRQSTYDEFLKGTAHGVAVRSDGRLELAPKFTLLADADASYLWSIRLDPKGTLYAAGGSPAKVFRFDSNGKPAVVFDSTDLSAQAIAFDSRGTLYVGTSPDGKVYRVSPSGEKSVFFDPKTKYIWDLAFSPDGTIYVATVGEKPRAGQAPTAIISTPQGTTTITTGGVVASGQVQPQQPFVPFPPLLSSSIYRISADGAPEELWSSREDIVYALGLASDGRLLAGSGNSGALLAVDGHGVFAHLAK